MNAQLPNYIKPEYRPDIDGLRALAVLAVVAYHAFPTTVKGGFIGVDIFFVISGFLISTLIFQNLEHHSFSFMEFYSRRIKRIFPALLLVLSACFLFGWIGLYSDEYQQLGEHIVAGGGFFSNLLLWHESGYFDSLAEAKSLLHLWSLGIEEQFYIVCPFMLWFLWKRQLNPLMPVLLLFIVSFLLNINGIHHDSVGTFYSPQTRFWELLLGVLLAYHRLYDFQWKQKLNLKIKSTHLSFIGLGLIVGGFLFVSKLRLFPGAWALLPTIGAALIIGAGSQAWFNKHVLANKGMVWLGLISFPLYLWHWPILSFIHILNNGADASRMVRIFAVLSAILLAWLTYCFIEKPIRHGKNTMPLIFIAITLIFGGFLIYKNEGVPSRATLMAKKHSWTDKEQVLPGYEQSKIYHQAPAIKDRDFYLSNTVKEEANIAIIGDSHANRIYWALSLNKEMKLINLGRGTCPPLLDVEVFQNNGESIACQPLTNNYLKYIKENPHIKLIIINAFYKQYQKSFVLKAHNKKISLEDALSNTLNYLNDSDKKIVVALDVPDVPKTCYQRNFPVWNTKLNTICTVSPAEFALQNQSILSILSHYPKVAVFNPQPVFCDAQCGEIDANNYLYLRDGHHLSDFGLAKLSPVLHDFLIKELV